MKTSRHGASSTGRMLRRACALAMACVVYAAPVAAGQLTGGFAAFEQCPRLTPTVNFCLHTQTTGGEVLVGAFRIPLVHPIEVQGGYHRNSETGEEKFYGALNGETMSRVPEPVPGGLLGILDPRRLTGPAKVLFKAAVSRGLTTVTATTELASTAGSIGLNTDNLINEEGIGLVLQVKIHVQNPLLGNACYIGSARAPVVLGLTSGTTRPPGPNEPISGRLGDVQFVGEPRSSGIVEFTEVENSLVVDNSFAVPGASGCGGVYAPTIDAALDAKLGLPSPAGRNAMVQQLTIKFATTQKVAESEG